MSIIGQGEESCIFQAPDNRHVISVLKYQPNDLTWARLNRINDILRSKDPTQQFFVTGDLHEMSIGEFNERFNLNLEECERRDYEPFGPTIYFSYMPKLENLRSLEYGLSGAQKDHLRQGLRILHREGIPLAHGDIKGDNIMLKGPNPVYIDFGHSHEIGTIEEINAEQDIRKLEDFLREPPPVQRRIKRGPFRDLDDSDAADMRVSRMRF
jgi:serine/threonine protein kinase